MADTHHPAQAPASDGDLMHIATEAEWDEAQRRGAVAPASLGSEGFVHCSFAGQVRGVADRFYRGRADVVLLTIDPARLDAEARVEDLVGAGEHFPHVYGPVAVAAVVAAVAVPLGPDGRLVLDDGPAGAGTDVTSRPAP